MTPPRDPRAAGSSVPAAVRAALRAAGLAPLVAGTLAAGALGALGARPLDAQAQTALAAGARTTAPALGAPIDTTALTSLRWREVGPFRGGRSVAVAGSKARPTEYWMGTTGGGVFKSADGGTTWSAASDGYFGGTIGAIAVDERNPDVVWVGGGETPIRGNTSFGEGLWRTRDAGKTWQPMGLRDMGQLGRIVLHPSDSSTLYVAALGNVFKPTAERGVYRSRDAGRSWQRVLFRHDSAGAIDLVMDPSNPRVLYAALWQAGRTPWSLSSGGRHSGIFKTTDGGDTWTELTRKPGLPPGIMGKIGLAVSPANPQRVWAIVENDSGGVYRSDDGGESWQLTNDGRNLRQRAWYYSHIYADPKNADVMYALNTGFYRSTDGGKTFKAIPVPHGDNHDLWIAPDDPERMIEANDGGANVSTDGGKNWTEQDYATAQMYHVSTTNHFPYRICGAQQDNSTLCGPSRAERPIDMSMWYDAGGCESGYVTADPRNPDVTYAGCYGGSMDRADARSGMQRSITPWPLNPMGQSSEDIKYRFQWTYPIVFSRHEPGALYVGGSQLFVSRDEGQSWQIASPPLARNDPKTMGPSGGPITKDQTGVETYGTIFTFDESPRQAGLFWAGSDDGLIHISRDAGKTWTNVTPPELPPYTRVSMIEPSPYEAGTAYVAANRYQMADLRPILLKTTDFGATWTRIDAGIPADEFTRVLRADPVRRGLLFAGTERGVWMSMDDGATWQSLDRNLPTVPVHDLVIKEGDLIAATHGRSFWVMDDISPLRQLTPQVTAKPVHLFQPRDAYRIQWGPTSGGTGASPRGANPPSGVTVHYWLADPAREVKVEFLDAAGTVVRSFTSQADTAKADSTAPGRRGGGRQALPSTKAGANSFAWNLRHEDASRFDGMIMWAGSTVGPVAAPGRYTVRLTADGRTETSTFDVLRDPRTGSSDADVVAQVDFLLDIRNAVTRANDAVKTIRNVKWQLDEREKAMPGRNAARFARFADDFARQLSAVEEELYQVRNQSSQDPLNFPIKLNNKLAALTGHVASYEAKPTAQARQVYAELNTELDAQLATLKATMDRMLPQANRMLAAAKLPEIVPSTEEPPRKASVAADEEEDDSEERKDW